MVVYSSLPDAEIPNITLDQYIFSFLERHGDKVSMVDADYEANTLTFRQIKEKSIKFAKALLYLGVRKGDRVAVCLSNCNEYVCLLLATSMTGGILTTCNPNYTKEEISHQFENYQPTVVFFESNNCETVKSVSEKFPCIKHVLSIDECFGYESFEDVIEKVKFEEISLSSQQVDSDDICMLLSSSGTTGLPKGVMLSHRNVIAIIQLSRISFDARSFDVLYLILPMFHVFGILVTTVGLVQGALLVVRRRYSVETFFRDVEKYKVTYVQAVPPIILDIYNSSLNLQYDTSSLKRILSGAAPLPQSVAELVRKKLKISIFQGWGATEAVPLTVSTADPVIPVNSIGFVVSNTMLKVIDPDTSKELGPNKDGEILAKGPQVMMGYYKNPSATAESIDKDGWYHTGDIGHYDKFGLFYIVDRLKEFIKYKGFQVAPAELEELLLRHPGISDAAVIGVSDPDAGEVPKAYLVKKEKQLTSNDIHEFLKGKVSSFKYLRGGVVFCDSIPKSASGKILRRELRALEKRSKL